MPYAHTYVDTDLSRWIRWYLSGNFVEFQEKKAPNGCYAPFGVQRGREEESCQNILGRADILQEGLHDLLQRSRPLGQFLGSGKNLRGRPVGVVGRRLHRRDRA